MFNKPTNKTWEEIEHPYLGEYQLTEWISEGEMSEVEKLNNPGWEARQGYLKTFSYSEMWDRGWKNDSNENKSKFFKLPNFNLEVFKEITGLDVSEEYQQFLEGENV